MIGFFFFFCLFCFLNIFISSIRLQPFHPFDGSASVFAGMGVMFGLGYPLRCISVRMMSPLIVDTKITEHRVIKDMLESSKIDLKSKVRLFYSGFLSYSLSHLIFFAPNLFHLRNDSTFFYPTIFVSYMLSYPFLNVSNNQIVSSMFPLLIDNSTRVESRSTLSKPSVFLPFKQFQYSYTGISDCLSTMWRNGGFKSIYAGFSVKVLSFPVFVLLHQIFSVRRIEEKDY